MQLTSLCVRNKYTVAYYKNLPLLSMLKTTNLNNKFCHYSFGAHTQCSGYKISPKNKS